MVKKMEVFLLRVIINVARQNVKRLAQALERGVDFEELNLVSAPGGSGLFYPNLNDS